MLGTQFKMCGFDEAVFFAQRKAIPEQSCLAIEVKFMFVGFLDNLYA
jgi:hypothetical protein